MKLFKRGKDGGPDSTVWGFWLIESKRLFSVALLKFVGDSREAFHTHAFHCLSWVLKGQLTEYMLDGRVYQHRPSWVPLLTTRKDFHKVDSVGITRVFTLRGPWLNKWLEYLPHSGRIVTLTNGREVVQA